MEYSNAGMFSSNTARDTHVMSRAVFDSIAVYIYIYIYVCVCVCVCHCFMVFCLFGNFAKDRSPDYDVCVYLLVAYLFIYYS